MVKIDNKDKLLLYLLHQNSRQSFENLSKALGISKSAVNHRVQQLVSRGIVKGFRPYYDDFTLGFTSIRFHFTYQYTTPEIEREIINYFVQNPYTTLVASGRGMFDLSVIFTLKDIDNIYPIWKTIQRKFSDYFQKQSMSFFINSHLLDLNYLLDDPKRSKEKRLTYNVESKRKNLDNMDRQILKELSVNARIPFSRLATKLGCCTATVRNRILKFENEGIIKGYSIDININLLGYHYFKVYLFFKHYTERNKIVEHIQYHPNLLRITETTGESHLELGFHLKSLDQLHDIMQNLTQKFPYSIRNYQYVVIIEHQKLLVFPQYIQVSDDL